MITVNLDYIGIKVEDRVDAIWWLVERYGPAGKDWEIDQLTYVKFKNDKHATHFVLRFS